MATRGQQNRPGDDIDYQSANSVTAEDPNGSVGGPYDRTEGGSGDDSAQAQGKRPATAGVRKPYDRSSADIAPGEDPPSRQAGVGDSAKDSEEGQIKSIKDRESWLIQRAHEIYTSSTDYLDANITNQWETNLAHFHSQHAPDTVYRRLGFKRSRLFRPKTRSNLKTQESSLATAVFSTQEVVDIQPQNPKDDMQRLAAPINKYILEWRLEHQIPWFQTVQGAYQDTKNYGLCITHQYWDYHEDTDIVPALDEAGQLIFGEGDDGERVPMGEERTRIRRDKLQIDNIAPENFRFDPMCDWRDPVGSSPFLVYMMPMYAGEALEMMEKVDPKTNHPTWKTHTLGAILGTRRQDYDRTRQAREGRERIDPADEQHGNSFTTVWAHMNIIRINGEDIVYWTMGTEILLTDAIPLRDLYPELDEGERPFVVGFSTIETHRNYPAGDVEQSAGLQKEINSIANQRMDNVKLVLNKRYHIRRGSQVDLDALVRNVPGGGVMMNDPEKDVKVLDTPDVTGSSYQEHDRLSVEFDELVGNMSQGSVMSNRSLNETVGGMAMMGQSANAVSDYSIRIFMETWMQPVLRQLVRLIQHYETDEVVLALAASQQDLFIRFGLNEITDSMLKQNLFVRINVGMGNTDPVRRVERLVMGLKETASLPGMMGRLKSTAVTDEIFGSLGYRDASRFYMDDEEFAKDQEENPPKPDPEIALKQDELRIREEDNQLRNTRELQKLDDILELGYAKLALDKEIKLQDVYAKLGIEGNRIRANRESETRRDKTQRDTAALAAAQKSEEIGQKRAAGGGT